MCKGYCSGRHWASLGAHKASGFNVGNRGNTKEPLAPLCRSPSRRPLLWSPLLSRQPAPVAKREARTTNYLPWACELTLPTSHRLSTIHSISPRHGTVSSPLHFDLDHGCISAYHYFADTLSPAALIRKHGNFLRAFFDLRRSYLVEFVHRAHPLSYGTITGAAAIENRRPDSPLQLYLEQLLPFLCATCDTSLLPVARQ